MFILLRGLASGSDKVSGKIFRIFHFFSVTFCLSGEFTRQTKYRYISKRERISHFPSGHQRIYQIQFNICTFLFFLKKQNTHNKQSLLSLERAWGSVFGQCHVGLTPTEQMPPWLGSLLSLLIFSSVWFGSQVPIHDIDIYLTHRGEVGEKIITIGVWPSCGLGPSGPFQKHHYDDDTCTMMVSSLPSKTNDTTLMSWVWSQPYTCQIWIVEKNDTYMLTR